MQASSVPGFHGNNITARDSHVVTGGRRVFVDRNLVLAEGVVSKFYFYAHPSGLSGTANVRLQVWRPGTATDSLTLLLVWQTRVQVPFASNGIMYEVRAQWGGSTGVRD